MIFDVQQEHHQLYQEAAVRLGIGYPLVFFTIGEELIRFLQATSEKPFIIFSDVETRSLDAPHMSGMELRQLIMEDQFLRRKSIPFIFLSSSLAPHHVHKAFDLSVQGFFPFPKNREDMMVRLRHVLTYWEEALHPNVL